MTDTFIVSSKCPHDWRLHGSRSLVQYAPFSHDQALRDAGLREEIHPVDVYAQRFRTRRARRQAAACNRRHFGNPTLAKVNALEGYVLIVDLRPQLAKLGIVPTDPRLP